MGQYWILKYSFVFFLEQFCVHSKTELNSHMPLLCHCCSHPPTHIHTLSLSSPTTLPLSSVWVVVSESTLSHHDDPRPEFTLRFTLGLAGLCVWTSVSHYYSITQNGFCVKSPVLCLFTTPCPLQPTDPEFFLFGNIRGSWNYKYVTYSDWLLPANNTHLRFPTSLLMALQLAHFF